MSIGFRLVSLSVPLREPCTSSSRADRHKRKFVIENVCLLVCLSAERAAVRRFRTTWTDLARTVQEAERVRSEDRTNPKEWTSTPCHIAIGQHDCQRDIARHI